MRLDASPCKGGPLAFPSACPSHLPVSKICQCIITNTVDASQRHTAVVWRPEQGEHQPCCFANSARPRPVYPMPNMNNLLSSFAWELLVLQCLTTADLQGGRAMLARAVRHPLKAVP